MIPPTPAAAPDDRPVAEAFILGPYATNCYLVRGPRPGGCWIADAGFDPDPLIERLRELGLRPEAIVLTHAHLDHIAGVDDVLAAFPGTPVMIHEAERAWPGDPERNLSAFAGMPITCAGPDRTLADGETLDLAGARWGVLHTPGHSPGGIALHHAPSGVVISGDALFRGSIGRTDFPGCDFDELERSIRARLYTLPGSTRVLPGHGAETTIDHERRTNPFVRPT